MNKPSDIEQWAWDKAVGLTEYTNIEQDVMAMIALAFMTMKTELQTQHAGDLIRARMKQREIDAKLCEGIMEHGKGARHQPHDSQIRMAGFAAGAYQCAKKIRVG